MNNNRIWYLRKWILGLTQEKFAEQISCSTSYIGFLELEKRPLSAEILNSITKKWPFINREWLLGNSDKVYIQHYGRLINYNDLIKIKVIDQEYIDADKKLRERTEQLQISNALLEFLRDLESSAFKKIKGFDLGYDDVVNKLTFQLYDDAIKKDTNFETYDFYKEDEFRVFPLEDTSTHDEIFKNLKEAKKLIAEIDASQKLQEDDEKSDVPIERYIDDIWKMIKKKKSKDI